MSKNLATNLQSGKNIAENVKEVLADTYFLYLKTQNYHWNVTGPNFKSLHELFEKQYKELAKAVDLLAERVRALGEFAPASLKAFASLSDIKEETREGISSVDMLKQLAKDHDSVLASIRKSLAIAQEEGDDATADILITRIEVHDKSKWMLASSL